VLRLDDEELEAIRAYVASGGRLYASGYTSLVSVDGVKRTDFALADVFGCHFDGEESSPMCYARPSDDALRAAIAPLGQIPYGRDDRHGIHPRFPGTALRIRHDADAVVRATVALPYADGLGTRDDENWSSIHGSPPWQDTLRAAIVEHRYGRGTVIYNSGDLEVAAASRDNDRARSLFLALISSLLPAPPRFELDSDPGVWAAAFDDPDAKRLRLNLANQPDLLPPRPVPSVRFRLTPPTGGRYASLDQQPEDGTVEYRIDESGAIEGELRGLRHFVVLTAAYE
jgi:hypothetical protein